LAGEGVVAGAFRLAFAPANRALKIIAWGANLRSRWLQMPYGDQALFMRRDVFNAVGGFSDMVILEDLVLVKKLKRRGRIVTRPEAIVTSPRRWQQGGYVRHTLLNQMILLGFFFNISLDNLVQWYRARDQG